MNCVSRATLGIAILAVAFPAAAQTGGIEFVAHVTPAAGRAEPARQLPFYLLRKSFADTQKEAEQSESKPDVNRFVDSLAVSKELKAWMKRTHSIQLSGEDFLSRVTVDDIFAVTEFFDAWMARNAGDTSMGFPAPKYRDEDRQRSPEKYAKRREAYLAALRKFLEANPHTKDGIDIHLTSIDPSQRWEEELETRRRRVRQLTLELAQTRYLVAKTETDLDGRGAFTGLAPGRYWLSTLGIEALVGDVRLRWDTPVEVQAGQVTHIELSNLNAVPRDRPAR